MLSLTPILRAHVQRPGSTWLRRGVRAYSSFDPKVTSKLPPQGLSANEESKYWMSQTGEAHIKDPRTSEPRPPFALPLGVAGEGTQEMPGKTTEMRYKPDHGEDDYVGHGRLLDRKAIITGGDSGIGRAVALAYAREGADVLIQYLPQEEEDARETQRLCQEAGRRCELVAVDFTEGDAACKRVVDRAVEAFGGRIDVLVSNASQLPKNASTFEDFVYERVESVFTSNVVAMMVLIKYALPHMKPGGSIICTTSSEAYYPVPGVLDYASSKGAILTLVKGLAQDITPKKGIRVNGVAPGPVWTPMIPQAFPKPLVQTFGNVYTPLNRPAQPRELSPLYVFFASDEASYISGEVTGVTGGQPT